MKLTDVVGNLIGDDSRITDKNVNVAPYTKFDFEKGYLENVEVEINDNGLFGGTIPDGFKVKVVNVDDGTYKSFGGFLVYKEDKPIIFTNFPGDERGFLFFNNTFIITGHDGNYLYNLDNHHEFARMSW